MGTNDADLTTLNNGGTKIPSWHGGADDIIPVGGSTQGCDRAAALGSDENEYFKLSLEPGVWHCSSGVGAAPVAILDQLVAWVENGTSPHTVPARGTQSVKELMRILVSIGVSGGNATLASSYGCINPVRLT